MVAGSIEPNDEVCICSRCCSDDRTPSRLVAGQVYKLGNGADTEGHAAYRIDASQPWQLQDVMRGLIVVGIRGPNADSDRPNFELCVNTRKLMEYELLYGAICTAVVAGAIGIGA